MTLRYENLFISDTHLGLHAAKTEYLLDFLKHCACDRLYLVGDIFDQWKMKTGWHWPTVNSEIVRLVLDKAKRGIRQFLTLIQPRRTTQAADPEPTENSV